jgi:hypothetical protein
MAKGLSLRAWATPLTIGAFFFMAGTGILMFFGRDGALTTVAHQWFSWIFLTGVVSHITTNFHLFKRHLKSRWAQVGIAAFLLVFIVTMFSWGLITGPQLRRPIERALVDAPLSALADIRRLPPGVLIGKFKAHGIVATNNQTVRDLALKYRVGANRLLGIVFLPN